MRKLQAVVGISVGGLLGLLACSSDEEGSTGSTLTGGAAGSGAVAGGSGGVTTGGSGGSGGGGTGGGAIAGGTGGATTTGGTAGEPTTSGGTAGEPAATGGTGNEGGVPADCCQMVYSDLTDPPTGDENLCKVSNATTCWACEDGCYDHLKPPGDPAPISACGCTDGDRCFRVENRCDHEVRLRAAGNQIGGSRQLDDASIDMAPGGCEAFGLTDFKSGRIWGETGCQDGNCNPGPHTLAEFTTDYGGTDWYNLSHVDGANLPMGLYLVDGTYTPQTNVMCECQHRECRIDLKNTTCLEEQRLTDDSGEVFACTSRCAITPDSDPNKDLYCCRGAYANDPRGCTPPPGQHESFRFACPQVYSYPYDEPHEVDGEYALCTCNSDPDFDIIFCP